MKAIILPLILALVGTGGGIGAGIMLQPPKEELAMAAEDPCGDPETARPAAEPASEVGPAREYARLNNQFIVPVVEQGRVAAMVVLSLNVEVLPGMTAAVFAAEPRLRDGFLQNMFDHANTGGFSGNFTQLSNMRALRGELMKTARRVLGDDVTDVLILDIVRQDN